MGEETFPRDPNRVPVVGGVTDDANLFPTALRVDPSTKRLKTVTTGTVTVSGDIPSHYSGSVGTTPVDTITPASTTKSVLIENTHASQNILISFDDGTKWKTILPYGVFSIDCSVTSFKVKGSGAATTYEGVYLV